MCHSVPVFLTLGFGLEQETVGRQKERDTLTWVRTTSDESYDRWINKGHYLNFTHGFGYRWFPFDPMTVSLRLNMDHVVASTQTSEDEELFSPEVDTSMESRDSSRTEFLMYVGLALQ